MSCINKKIKPVHISSPQPQIHYGLETVVSNRNRAPSSSSRNKQVDLNMTVAEFLERYSEDTLRHDVSRATGLPDECVVDLIEHIRKEETSNLETVDTLATLTVDLRLEVSTPITLNEIDLYKLAKIKIQADSNPKRATKMASLYLAAKLDDEDLFQAIHEALEEAGPEGLFLEISDIEAEAVMDRLECSSGELAAFDGDGELYSAAMRAAQESLKKKPNP